MIINVLILQPQSTTKQSNIMKNIPQKYYKEKNQREALSNLRRIVSSGLSVKDIALQLSSRYETADDSEKKHIGKLLASVYDFKSSTIAKECAFLFGYKMREWLSVGENMFIEGYHEKDNLLFRKQYSNRVIENSAKLFDNFEGGRRRILQSASMENVLTINKAHQLYAAIHTNGEVSIFIVESCGSDMLVEEVSVMGDVPLYFTESTHFVSPVFKIKLVKIILDYCLKEIGYPAITINPKVIFADVRANLLNRSDFEGPEAIYDDWKGIEIIMYSDVDPKYPINDVGCWGPMESENGILLQLRAALINSLSATALICNTICEETKMPKLTSAALAALCKKHKVFQ